MVLPPGLAWLVGCFQAELAVLCQICLRALGVFHLRPKPCLRRRMVCRLFRHKFLLAFQCMFQTLTTLTHILWRNLGRVSFYLLFCVLFLNLFFFFLDFVQELFPSNPRSTVFELVFFQAAFWRVLGLLSGFWCLFFVFLFLPPLQVLPFPPSQACHFGLGVCLAVDGLHWLPVFL